jgi:hypothetical protein
MFAPAGAANVKSGYGFGADEGRRAPGGRAGKPLVAATFMRFCALSICSASKKPWS